MNPYAVSYFPIAVLSFSYFLYIFLQKESISNWKFIVLNMLYFLTCASGEWIETSLGQDNYQWFFIGKNLFDDFDTWHQFFGIYDHTRIFTALPVGMLWWLSGLSPHLIFKILVILSFFILLTSITFIVNQYVSAKHTQLTIALFTICISCFGAIDFWTFNSEHMVILLFMLSMFCLHRSTSYGHDKFFPVFFTGVFICASPFAKEQFGLSAIAVYLTISIYFITKKRISTWVYLTLGCLTTAAIIGFLCLYHASWETLRTYYAIGFEYQNRSFASQEPIALNSFFFQQFLKLTLINPHHILMTLSILLLAFLSFNRKFKSPLFGKNTLITTSMIVYFGCTLLSILLAKKNIAHYNILLYPGFLFFFAFFIDHFMPKYARYSILLVIYITSAPILVKSMQSIYPVPGYAAAQVNLNDDPSHHLIKQTIPKNKKVLLWGYANQHMVGIDAKRCSSYLTSQFAFLPIACSENIRNQYLTDLNRFHPDYVIELVGPSQFFTTDKQIHSIAYAHPQMKKQLDLNYTLIVDSADIKIYKKIL